MESFKEEIPNSDVQIRKIDQITQVIDEISHWINLMVCNIGTLAAQSERYSRELYAIEYELHKLTRQSALARQHIHQLVQETLNEAQQTNTLRQKNVPQAGMNLKWNEKSSNPSFQEPWHMQKTNQQINGIARAVGESNALSQIVIEASEDILAQSNAMEEAMASLKWYINQLDTSIAAFSLGDDPMPKD
jgi:methyl-accepting chemotaxis protein